MSNRLLAFLCVLLTGFCMVLALENRAVRNDQRAMQYAYGSFLARRVNGKPLTSMIRRNSLAVFKAPEGIVACGQMGE